MLISFLFFTIVFFAVGVLSSYWRQQTVDDYLLAGRNVPSWLVGLSYGATLSSGASFIGFAGLAYHSGIAAVYGAVGLILGDYIGWRIAGTKLRRKAHERQLHTYPSLVGKLGDHDFNRVTLLVSVLTIIFMSTYCAAQLVAGAKIGATLFHWDFSVFVVLGALVLLVYCWAGGIRASIWTDAVQALIMVLSLIILITAGLLKIGGIDEMWRQLNALNPKLTDPFYFDRVLMFVGWLFFGIGVLGQPQLMVRHMVARDDQSLVQARRIYFVWRVLLLGAATLSGLVARVLIPATDIFDPELSIPLLWQDLLPPVLVGFLIAGLFSATMSTADSLLLACSSALTQHLVPGWRNSYFFARLGTIFIVIFVAAVALVASKGVLALVVLAWGGMASALVPMITLQLFGFKMSERLALTIIFSGITTSIAWRYGLGLHGWLFDLVPGILAGFAVYFLAGLVAWKTSPQSGKI